MSNPFTKTQWEDLRRKATHRWNSYRRNPLLPSEERESKTLYWLTVEETADNALDLIKQGYSLHEAWQMADDFMTWKLGGGA